MDLSQGSFAVAQRLGYSCQGAKAQRFGEWSDYFPINLAFPSTLLLRICFGVFKDTLPSRLTPNLYVSRAFQRFLDACNRLT